MDKTNLEIGFTYFLSPKKMIHQQLASWLPALQKCGASYVVFSSNFNVAVPEDAFSLALENGLQPWVHFKTTLPSAKSFNETSLLLDIYKRWGCEYVILGEKPNLKENYQIADWHLDLLAERYLDRFIPLAHHAIRIGLKPILAPLEPGGDYWDCAFLELLIDGLIQRKMNTIIEKLNLSSFGFTHHKDLIWGSGGPELWAGSTPYFTPEGQEDQLGFNNYQWVRAIGQRITGQLLPVVILDAGRPESSFDAFQVKEGLEDLKIIIQANYASSNVMNQQNNPNKPIIRDVIGCTFSLDTLFELSQGFFSPQSLEDLFSVEKPSSESVNTGGQQKQFSHYLLLPAYSSGISDAVLNKVRPFIKQVRPTVGFSLQEAVYAEKVSVYPDPYHFDEEQIEKLRASGCTVEFLPESGIEIATLLQNE